MNKPTADKLEAILLDLQPLLERLADVQLTTENGVRDAETKYNQAKDQKKLTTPTFRLGYKHTVAGCQRVQEANVVLDALRHLENGQQCLREMLDGVEGQKRTKPLLNPPQG